MFRHAAATRLVVLLFSAMAIIGIDLASPSLRADQDVTDPKFNVALQKGEAALKVRRYQEALDAFKEANGVADRKSATALLGISRAYYGLGAFKSAADACADALKHVGENPDLAARIHNQRGMSLSSLAQKTNDRVLKDAEAEFRAVLVMTDAYPIVWYNLGVVLLKQERDQEGIIALQAYVDSGVRAPEIELAKAMMFNPRRAREPYAPDFGFTTHKAEYVELKDLQGKVVLLDFWGMWCGPCLAATPELVQMHRRLAPKEPFEMIGISSDPPRDETKWRAYIADNKMEWPNYIDADRKLHRLFDVDRFPTYIVVDAEGIMRFRHSGWGGNAARTLEAEIRDALKRLRRSSAPEPLLEAPSR